MKYKIMLVDNTGEIVDESSFLLSAENAIALIKEWESMSSAQQDMYVDIVGNGVENGQEISKM